MPLTEEIWNRATTRMAGAESIAREDDQELLQHNFKYGAIGVLVSRAFLR